jgi:large repetitive protein
MRLLLIVLTFGLLTSTGCSGCGDNDKANPDAGVDAPTDAGPDEMVCEELPPLASGTCEVTSVGAAQLIKGNILTPTTVFVGGQVAIDAEGKITCVGCDCAQGGETTIVCPGATVSPGLINTHEHITFQQAEPYTDTGERYEHRHQWRRGLDGHTEIPSTGGASSVKISFGELRYVMGGATSIVGSGGAAGLLRNLDSSTNQEGLNHKAVEFETFPLGDSSGSMRTADCNYGGTTVTPESLVAFDAFEPHTAEGINLAANNEFKCESSDTYDTTAPGLSENLLLPKTAMIHAIGLRPNDYGAMAAANTALIWSPRSNITLYGDTARVPMAARLGVEIALGTDWMPTGSMNLLRELHCADELNSKYYDGYFTDKQLWEMTTKNAASITATQDAIGSIETGKTADISIFAANGKTYYRAIIEAEPKDVALVLRGGKALYGDSAAVNALRSECDELDVCGNTKRVCTKPEIGKTFTELVAAVGTIYPAFACGTPTKEPSCVPKRSQAVNSSTVFTGEINATDSDGDGIADASDNCPKVFNPARPLDNGMQPDLDTDGQGDACDVCPFDANSTMCTAPDPNDRDGDGVANASDNCPDVSNSAQTDTDTDGKGDVCDPCPTAANPGNTGCPTTIYLVKMGMVANGTTVRILNALVTGKGSNGFFVQTKVGDAGYMGSSYSGLFVFTGSLSPLLANAVVGTRVTIDGNVATFQGQLELDSVSAVTQTTTTAEAAPDPVMATYAEVKTGGTKATELESVIVQVSAATVTAVDTAFGEFTLTSGTDVLVVDDFLYATPPPMLGTAFSSVTGILALRQSASKLEPRSAADLVAGAPILLTFSPALSYVREGATAAPTIPTALTVTLSGVAQGDTFVAITSSDTNALTIPGGGVTVQNGMTSATVLVDGVAQAADVTLTATLATTTKTAHVRVVGAAEVPATVTLSPATATIAPGGTQSITATLDIPAASGGTMVAVAVTPSNAGTVPATVTVAADQLSATFNFADASMVTSSTVTATLGSSTSNVTITVSSAAQHLVINELDYDSVGTDTLEYVEIYNPTGAAISLTDVGVVLINGNGMVAYPTTTSVISLASVGSLGAGEYLVLAGATVLATVPSSAKTLNPGWTQDAIQNGAPDGIALINTSTNTLIDALSYEGAITAAQVPGFAAPVSLVEGTVLTATVADNNATVAALCRAPNGRDTDNANADWVICTTLTPGAANP